MARRHIMESTFRLNLLNPQHAKINEVIKGLNPKIYKSTMIIQKYKKERNSV